MCICYFYGVISILYICNIICIHTVYMCVCIVDRLWRIGLSGAHRVRELVRIDTESRPSPERWGQIVLDAALATDPRFESWCNHKPFLNRNNPPINTIIGVLNTTHMGFLEILNLWRANRLGPKWRWVVTLKGLPRCSQIHWLPDEDPLNIWWSDLCIMTIIQTCLWPGWVPGFTNHA